MIILYLILFTYITWVFFLAIMNLKRAMDNGTITQFALWMGYPVLGVGLVLDFILNALMSVPFLELPQWKRKEFLLSSRLERHLVESVDFREVMARHICQQLLDSFDPSGKHCKG